MRARLARFLFAAKADATYKRFSVVQGQLSPLFKMRYLPPSSLNRLAASWLSVNCFNSSGKRKPAQAELDRQIGISHTRVPKPKYLRSPADSS